LELTLVLRIVTCPFRARSIAPCLVGECRNGWLFQFLEQDLKTALPRKLHLASPNMIVELVERDGGLSNLESWQMLEQAIATGPMGHS
jgi:hypothetical protein